MARRASKGTDLDILRGRPFLLEVRTHPARVDPLEFPFTIPAFSHGIDLTFDCTVTFFVGENGTGKSTLLEAIALNAGFNPQGGSRDHRFGHSTDVSSLASALQLAWMPKVTQGFFMRAETFFNFASYIDEVSDGDLRAYGGKSLTAQSHGESFLSLFANRFKRGLYILDEPEAALSPQRQLSFLKIIHDLEQAGKAQFLIATHSPMLLAYPGATVLSLDGEQIEPIDYRETKHYLITKHFLDAPERYFKHLFSDDQQ